VLLIFVTITILYIAVLRFIFDGRSTVTCLEATVGARE